MIPADLGANGNRQAAFQLRPALTSTHTRVNEENWSVRHGEPSERVVRCLALTCQEFMETGKNGWARIRPRLQRLPADAQTGFDGLSLVSALRLRFQFCRSKYPQGCTPRTYAMITRLIWRRSGLRLDLPGWTGPVDGKNGVRSTFGRRKDEASGQQVAAPARSFFVA